MTKNLIKDPILACLTQIWALNFFWRVVPLLVVIQCSKLLSYAIYRKTNQTWEDGKKTNFGPDFEKFLALVQKNLFRGFYLYLQAITVCNFKEN